MSEFKIGAEFEFVSPVSAENIILGIANKINIQPYNRLPGGRRDYTRWFFIGDGSIRAPYGFHPLELVSPIMNFQEGLEKIKTVFDYIQLIGGDTNESTGFHIGLSFADPEKMKRVNPLKVVMLLNETKILSTFNRARNRYCTPHKTYLRKEIKTQAERFIRDGRRTGIESETEIKSLLKYDKYHTVNLVKLEQGYLEFRAMGGTSYHKRYDEVVKTINHYVECMESAIDPDMLKAKYQRLIDSLIRINDRSVMKYSKDAMDSLERSIQFETNDLNSCLQRADIIRHAIENLRN